MSNTLIISNSEVMCGKPVVKGTRITVELILEKLSMGFTVDEILEEHPTLTKEGIQAALRYAVESIKDELFLTIGKKAA
jgi:uncharacterized protein (DUF433 family)